MIDVLAATGAAFYAAAAFLILTGITAGLIARFRKRPPQADPPAAGAAPAPGPASSAGPPPSEITERRSPRPPVVPAPGPTSEDAEQPRIRIPVEGFGNLAKVTLTFDTGIKIHDDYITENTEIELPDVDGWGIGDFLEETP